MQLCAMHRSTTGHKRVVVNSKTVNVMTMSWLIMVGWYVWEASTGGMSCRSMGTVAGVQLSKHGRLACSAASWLDRSTPDIIYLMYIFLNDNQ
eukprot:3095122-Amphidinium_carterae.6